MSKKVDIFGPLYKPNSSIFVDMSFIKKRVLNIKLLICNIYLSHIITNEVQITFFLTKNSLINYLLSLKSPNYSYLSI